MENNRINVSRISVNSASIFLKFVFSPSILHRYPVIAKEMIEPWELKMHELQDKIEGDRRKVFLLLSCVVMLLETTLLAVTIM
ncbi:hypothetical protein EON65_34885 [archaeon]|nr:MAG: hypothetical protein EON65_34885 [archaeon]